MVLRLETPSCCASKPLRRPSKPHGAVPRNPIWHEFFIRKIFSNFFVFIIRIQQYHSKFKNKKLTMIDVSSAIDLEVSSVLLTSVFSSNSSISSASTSFTRPKSCILYAVGSASAERRKFELVFEA